MKEDKNRRKRVRKRHWQKKKRLGEDNNREIRGKKKTRIEEDKTKKNKNRGIQVKMKTRAEADYRIEEDKDLGRQRSKEYKDKRK